jgi:hypothetical protein
MKHSLFADLADNAAQRQIGNSWVRWPGQAVSFKDMAPRGCCTMSIASFQVDFDFPVIDLPGELDSAEGIVVS